MYVYKYPWYWSCGYIHSATENKGDSWPRRGYYTKTSSLPSCFRVTRSSSCESDVPWLPSHLTNTRFVQTTFQPPHSTWNLDRCCRAQSYNNLELQYCIMPCSQNKSPSISRARKLVSLSGYKTEAACSKREVISRTYLVPQIIHHESSRCLDTILLVSGYFPGLRCHDRMESSLFDILWRWVRMKVEWEDSKS